MPCSEQMVSLWAMAFAVLSVVAQPGVAWANASKPALGKTGSSKQKLASRPSAKASPRSRLTLPFGADRVVLSAKKLVAQKKVMSCKAKCALQIRLLGKVRLRSPSLSLSCRRMVITVGSAGNVQLVQADGAVRIKAGSRQGRAHRGILRLEDKSLLLQGAVVLSDPGMKMVLRGRSMRVSLEGSSVSVLDARVDFQHRASPRQSRPSQPRKDETAKQKGGPRDR